MGEWAKGRTGETAKGRNGEWAKWRMGETAYEPVWRKERMGLMARMRLMWRIAISPIGPIDPNRF